MGLLTSNYLYRARGLIILSCFIPKPFAKQYHFEELMGGPNDVLKISIRIDKLVQE